MSRFCNRINSPLAQLWKYGYNIDRIGQPVNRHGWWLETCT
jgi:hypothetical protein